MRWLAGLTVLAAGGYLAAVAILYGLQDRFVFPAFGTWMPAAEVGVPGLQDVRITTADGERLAGWWRPPEPGRALLVYFHGNGGSLANRRDRIRALAADGRGILIVTYRGYPGSTGRRPKPAFGSTPRRPTRGSAPTNRRASCSTASRSAPASRSGSRPSTASAA